MEIVFSKIKRFSLWMAFTIVFLCFFRVIFALAGSKEIIEVYPTIQSGTKEETRQLEQGEPQPIGVMLETGPEEEVFGQVPGAERLKRAAASEVATQGTIQVPEKRGRAIASIPAESVPKTQSTGTGIMKKNPESLDVQELSVIVDENGFSPREFVVTEGIPVRLFLTTTLQQPSCFIVNEWNIQKGIQPGQKVEVSFVPRINPGNSKQFRFYCPIQAQSGLAQEGHFIVRQKNRSLASTGE